MQWTFTLQLINILNSEWVRREGGSVGDGMGGGIVRSLGIAPLVESGLGKVNNDGLRTEC